jgi:hypothetical protein
MADAATIISQAMDAAVTPAVTPTVTAPVTPATPPVEQVHPQVSSDPSKGDDFNKRFEALNAKERDLWKKSHEISQREAAYKQAEELKARIDKDPLGYLKEKGLPYDEVAKRLLQDADGKARPLTSQDADKLKQELREQIMAEFQEQQKAEQAKVQTETTIKGFKEEIKQFVDTNPDKFGLIKAFNEQPLVWEVIEEDYKRKYNEYGPAYANENLMTKEVAAQKVNAHLDLNLQNLLKSEPVRNLVMEKLSKLGFDLPANQTTPVSEQPNIPRTLTNDGFARTQSGTPPKTAMSESDRMKAVLKALESGKPQ